MTGEAVLQLYVSTAWMKDESSEPEMSRNVHFKHETQHLAWKWLNVLLFLTLLIQHIWNTSAYMIHI